jgi:hypothetical protein
MVINAYVIVFDEFYLSPLSHVQLLLRENILQASVIGVDLTSVPHKIVSPCLEGMDNSGKL